MIVHAGKFTGGNGMKLQMMGRLACLVLAMAVLALGIGVFTRGGAAPEDTWRDGSLTGMLLRVDEEGNRTYLVKLDPGAVDADNFPLTAQDYVCTLLLVEPFARMRMISDAEFELTVEAGVELPYWIDPVSPQALGLEVLNGEDGAYLVGDTEMAKALLAEILGIPTIEMVVRPIPLDPGLTEDEIGNKENDQPTSDEELSDLEAIETEQGDTPLKSDEGEQELEQELESELEQEIEHGQPAIDEGEPESETEQTDPSGEEGDGAESDDPEAGEVESNGEEAQDPVQQSAPEIRLYAQIDGDQLIVGVNVTLTAEVTGIPEGIEYTLQWQNDMSGKFEDVPGKTGTSITFTVDEDNANCAWRVALRYE